MTSTNNLRAATWVPRAWVILILMALLAGIFFQLGAQRAAAANINFDNLAAGTLVTAPISGVTFTLANRSNPSIFAIAPTGGTTSSLPNTLLNAPSFDTATPASNLTMSFSTPVNAMNFTYTYDNGDITFTVFQGPTTTMITKPFTNSPLVVKTADFSAFSGVTALSMSSSFPNDYIAIDDLSFISVPEPATPVLGLLAICWWSPWMRNRVGHRRSISEHGAV